MGVGGPQSISRFLIRDKRRETQTQRTSHMKMKAEMGGGHKPREPWSPRNWKKQKGSDAGAPRGSYHLYLRNLFCRTRGG